jgi:putative PIN family toxin of toxin-antitoxin system
VRIFLDTNVLVSAFATRGLCADLLRHVLLEHELLTGEVNLTELRRVLKKKIRVPEATVDAIEELLRAQTIVPKPRKRLDVEIRDPADAWVLASAVAADSDLLVTGDRDLLDIASQAPVQIVDPRGCWKSLRQRRRWKPVDR